jgi:hypothetical protein
MWQVQPGGGETAGAGHDRRGLPHPGRVQPLSAGSLPSSDGTQRGHFDVL